MEVVEASTTLGLHILRNMYNVKKIDEYISVFRKLIEHGVLSPETRSAMIKLVRLRNLIVYRYWKVDDMRMYKEFKETGISVAERFLAEVERRVVRA